MAWFPISNVVPQYWKQAADGTNEYSGAVLKAYQVGTITNIPFATDNTGGATANSIALNANGNPEVSGNVVIPHLDQDYKLALYPDQTSADADSGAIWTIDDIDLMGFDSGSLNPEHATDTGTDTYESATNTTAPGPGVQIVRDFRSANTTTTPSLDSLTITTRDGSALWASALSGPHTLQLASDSGSWLLLDPNPIDEDDMASDSVAAVPTQQSVKAYADTKARIATGTYTGDGTESQSVTGLGFQPQQLWITKRETSTSTVIEIFYTNAVVVDDNASGMCVAIPGSSDNNQVTRNDRIVSLDADGFTVNDAGADADPNADGVTYNYVAIG